MDNFFHDFTCYTKKSGVTRVLQLSQRNGKLPLPQWKEINYPVIPVYGATDVELLITHIDSCLDYIPYPFLLQKLKLGRISIHK